MYRKTLPTTFFAAATLLFSGLSNQAHAAPKFPPNMLSIPMHSQETEYSCGAAAMLSVLDYWQVYSGPEKDLYDKLHTNPDYGTEGLDMSPVARDFGLESQLLWDVKLADLRKMIDAGDTVIMEIQAWSDNPAAKLDWKNDWKDGHFVVLAGLDDNYAYLVDGGGPGNYVYAPIQELMDRWHNEAEGPGRITMPYQHLAVVVRGIKRVRAPIAPETPLVPLD